MAQSKKQIAVVLKEKQKAQQSSGILPRQSPSVMPSNSTPGLGATRFNLRSGRSDSMPRTRRGSK